MNRPFLSLVLALALLITATPAVAAPETAQKEWLLNGSMQALETNQVVFPTLYVTGSGAGHATHLGRVTILYQATVDIPTLSAPVSAALIAANGDRLFAAGTGQSTPRATSPDITDIVERYTITGGTGRFADAHGSFRMERVLNLITGVNAGTFTGIIVIP